MTDSYKCTLCRDGIPHEHNVESLDIMQPNGTYKARIDTTYIDRLQRAWDDMFEVAGEPIVKFGERVAYQFPGTVGFGEGMIALVNKGTWQQLAKLDDPLSYYNY